MVSNILVIASLSLQQRTFNFAFEIGEMCDFFYYMQLGMLTKGIV